MRPYPENFVWEEFPLRIEHHRRNQPYNMRAEHYHDRYELYFLASGVRHFFIKDRTYRVSAGEIILVDRYELHKTTEAGTPAHERFLIGFYPDALPKQEASELLGCFCGENRLIRFESESLWEIENLFFKLARECRSAGAGFRPYLRLILTELLILINRALREAPPSPPETGDPVQLKMMDVVRFINDHFAEALSLPGLAAHFALSPYHLSRTFKRVTGFSFVEYLNSIRIREAERLLRETRLPVTEVAAKVGFENLTHFGRVFKSTTGTTPLRYRKGARRQ